MSITADEIPEVFEQQSINNRAVTPLNFEKAEGAAMAPDTLSGHSSYQIANGHQQDKSPSELSEK